MKLPKKTSQNAEKEGYYKACCEHSKSLRTWLVAYGIGAPALFISHPSILSTLSNVGKARLVGLLFLCGLTLQVCLSFCTKISMWYLYFGEHQPKFKETIRYKVCDWYSEQFWIDVIIDISTILFFGAATVQVFSAFITH